MVSGVDTTFLVELEMLESSRHAAAHQYLKARVLDAGHPLALAPQVLTEWIHVATDPKRFERPLDMAEAARRAQFWWRAKEVRQVFPGPEAIELFWDWMERFRLGRKRLLDTQLAATYHAAGIGQIVTTNARDFSVYGCFEVVTP